MGCGSSSPKDVALMDEFDLNERLMDDPERPLALTTDTESIGDEKQEGRDMGFFELGDPFAFPERYKLDEIKPKEDAPLPVQTDEEKKKGKSVGSKDANPVQDKGMWKTAETKAEAGEEKISTTGNEGALMSSFPKEWIGDFGEFTESGGNWMEGVAEDGGKDSFKEQSRPSSSEKQESENRESSATVSAEPWGMEGTNGKVPESPVKSKMAGALSGTEDAEEKSGELPKSPRKSPNQKPKRTTSNEKENMKPPFQSVMHLEESESETDSGEDPDRVAARKRRTKELLRIEKIKGSKIAKAMTTDEPKNKFLELLNHDPWEGDADGYSDEQVQKAIEKTSKLCRVRYEFDAFEGLIYPLAMLCALSNSGVSPDTIKKCYKAYPDALMAEDQEFGTPLHYACSFQAPTKVVKFLLKKEPSLVNKVNKFKRTPLHMACMLKASLEVVTMLLDASDLSTIGTKDGEGMTPLHLAAGHNDDGEVVNLLLEKYPKACRVSSQTGSTPLHLAVQSKASRAVLKALVKEDTLALALPDKEGCLPLHVAVDAKSSLKTYKLLVKNFPEGVNSKNKNGETPYKMAQTMRLGQDILHVLAP